MSQPEKKKPIRIGFEAIRWGIERYPPKNHNVPRCHACRANEEEVCERCVKCVSCCGCEYLDQQKYD